jgi:hypothetical protein
MSLNINELLTTLQLSMFATFESLKGLTITTLHISKISARGSHFLTKKLTLSSIYSSAIILSVSTLGRFFA